MKRLRKKNFALLFLLGMNNIFLSSCGSEQSPGWEYMPDMYRGPALEAYQAYGQFVDSLSARKPVDGTVPRGFMTYQNYSSSVKGYELAKANLKVPSSIKPDSITLMESAKLYGIYCSPCHGEKGDGQGILMKRDKFLGIPSYVDRDINMGSIFHVITYGKGVMGSHASQVTPEERWKIAYHVLNLRRALTDEGEETRKTNAAVATKTNKAEVMKEQQN